VWRLIALTITFVVTWLLIGDVNVSLEVALTVNITKTIAYYLYDKVWERKLKWKKTSI